MFFDQLCTAFDTRPRKLLRAGHILPCCPPAPALQPLPGYLTPLPFDACSAARCPACAVWISTNLAARSWLVDHSTITSSMLPRHVQQGRGGFPRWQPGGKLEGKLYTSNCMPKETLQKGVENIFHVFCLPHETAKVTPKTSGSRWEKLTALKR